MRTVKPADWIRRMMVSWMFAAAVEWFLVPAELRGLAGLEGLARMSFLRLVLVTVAGTAVLSGLASRYNTVRAERWGMAALFALVSGSAMRSSFSWAFLGICVLAEGILVGYCLWGWNSQPEQRLQPEKPYRAWVWITAELGIGFFLFLAVWGLGRFFSFFCANYDFGIFSQMYYSMAKTGLPMTTVERDGALSHFAVHVSPIYYVLLPFYMLAPTPAALQVFQAAVMASAVIPVWKIAGHHGLSGGQRTLVCVLLMVCPGFTGACSYDFHENCFLTPMILWLFYGIDRKNIPITVAATVLTLAVKEDAAAYVAVIALWLIVRALLRKDFWNLIAGLLLFAGALAWFAAAALHLSLFGEGIMSGRYRNFMYDGSNSLLTVVKTVILNPLKVAFECMEAEKLKYLALTMLPLLGLPLLTRRYERLLLLIPYLLFNLMSDYPYQHDIFFQYSFGSSAFLIYLTVVNAADLDAGRLRVCVLLCAVTTGAVLFSRTILPPAVSAPRQAVQYWDYYQEIRHSLSQIPEDASVTANTFYIPYLSQRDELYEIYYTTVDHVLESDYIVLNRNADGDFRRYAPDGYENLTRLLEANHFERLLEQGSLVIFVALHG